MYAASMRDAACQNDFHDAVQKQWADYLRSLRFQVSTEAYLSVGGNNREIGYPISGCVQFDLQREDRPTLGGSLDLSAAIVEAIIQAAAFHLPPVKANRRWPTPNPAKIRASSIGILTMEPVPGMSAFPTMMMRRFAGQKLISESIAIKIARML